MAFILTNPPKTHISGFVFALRGRGGGGGNTGMYSRLESLVGVPGCARGFARLRLVSVAG